MYISLEAKLADLIYSYRLQLCVKVAGVCVQQHQGGVHKMDLTNVCLCMYLYISAITLDNTLVILSTVAPDAGRYYAQAVNDKNGENKTSQPITLTVESKYM